MKPPPPSNQPYYNSITYNPPPFPPNHHGQDLNLLQNCNVPSEANSSTIKTTLLQFLANIPDSKLIQ